MAEAVLDTSAVLALLRGEPGADRVGPALTAAAISAANYAELISKLIERGSPADEAAASAADLGLEVVPLDSAAAVSVGVMYEKTRGHGISLGDRACLSLAALLGVPVLTADRAWAELDLGIEVVLIR